MIVAEESTFSFGGLLDELASNFTTLDVPLPGDERSCSGDRCIEVLTWGVQFAS